MKIEVNGEVIYDDSVPDGYCDLMGELPNHMKLAERKLSDMDSAPLDKMQKVMGMLSRRADEILSTRYWNS